MKKFITSFASILILAGLWPAMSSLRAQGQDDTYGPYQAQGAPPSPYQQPPYQQQGPYQGQGAPPPGYSQQGAPPSGYPQQGAPPEVAQNGQPQANSDQAQPGVARASYIHGDASSQRGDNGELVPLTQNTPLEAGDRVSTAHDGTVEIQLDYADVLRLSGDSTAKIANLNRQNIQVQVGKGLTTYSMLPGAEASAEIDTPNASLHPTAQGEFRIVVNGDDNTQITVRSGAADVSTPQGSTHVDAGQMITVEGTDNPQYKVDPAPARDAWDNWNEQRDSQIENASNYKNTDRYYTGSQDMNGYGEWSEVPDYGQVWTPNEGPDWAPYRDGRWVYEPYYGWTWVAAEPWGWAPYHYGRWFVYGGRWSWWPGPVYGYPGYYPIWAPAYVSFFGWGGGFGVGFGFGGGWGRVGWLPIGPGDWYHPWYGGWAGRYGVATFNNGRFIEDRNGFAPLHGMAGRQFSNMHDAFANDRIRGGMSSMAGSEFGRAAVPREQERVSDASFRQATMMTGRMPVGPSRESYSPTGREANAGAFRNMPSSSQRFFSPTHTAGNAGMNGRSSGGFNNGAVSRQQTPFSSGRSMGQENQGFSNGARGGAGNNQSANGWHSFTPPSHASQPQNYDRGYSQPNNSSRSYQAPAQGSREGGYGSNNRPTLNMRQPIVSPRGGSPEGNAPRGSYSAPESRGGESSAPRGGNYSAPRSSGGGSGGHSGGGHGGGHSSGGHGR